MKLFSKKNSVTNSLMGLQARPGAGQSLSRYLVGLGYRKISDLEVEFAEYVSKPNGFERTTR